MFSLSKSAAAEIKRSLQEHEFDDMPLRVAAQREEDGSIAYQMGFDDAGPGDTMVSSRGIDVIIARDHLALLNGAELDYVALEDAEGQSFIFLNPNDPNFVPPNVSDSDGPDSDPPSQASADAKTDHRGDE